MLEGDNLPWSEQYRLAGEDWADKYAAAQLLEESKSAVMAQKQAQWGDIPVNKAEQKVKSSREWVEYIENMVNARKAANLAKIKLEFLKMKFQEWQSSDANKRAEMRL